MANQLRKKVLFIDRDGTLIKEPADYQIDAWNKLVWVEKAISQLSNIANALDYELVMITNQDGLGTASHPEEMFWPIQNFIIDTLAGEGIVFEEILIDKTFPEENAITRKPNTGLLTKYFDTKSYDLANSFVIGDRYTDVELAKNLGCKAIKLTWPSDELGLNEVNNLAALNEVITLETNDWQTIYTFLKGENAKAAIVRKTNETDIAINLSLNGTGVGNMKTGLAFFDHMLDQIAKHSGANLEISCNGDLQVDEHHTVEDVAIALGEAFYKVLSNKQGMERYGYCLPMDECFATVAIDFGGRPELIWEATFSREKIGDVPTEMFKHFFKSFSYAAKANVFIKVDGENEHHKIESIFKAFARAIKMATYYNPYYQALPTTKGLLA